MDRTVIDRTVIDVRKAEEKQLDEILIKNLQKLIIVYQPTAELRECIEDDMFVKPNVKAFIHVMHFLFNILDPVEFKKRFYWPIYDKNIETMFRTSTVQYLNHLNEKHNLGWPKIEKYLVVKPGGLKFMVMLKDLIRFIVNEKIKKIDKELGETNKIKDKTYSSECIKKEIKRYEKFIDHSVNYKRTIEERKKSLIENITIINKKIAEIAKNVNIPVEQLMQNNFLAYFKESNKQLLKNAVTRKVDIIKSLDSPLKTLNELFTVLQSDQQAFPCKKSALINSFHEIQKAYPDQCQENIFCRNDQLNLEVLFNGFNCIVPEIEEMVMPSKFDADEILEYEHDQFKKLHEGALEFSYDVTRFDNILARYKSTEKKIDLNVNSGLAGNLMRNKFVNTPPINFNNMPIDSKRCRLALIDEKSTKDWFTFSSNQTTVHAPKSSKKHSFLQSSFNKTNKMDPVNLLRTLTKKKPYRNAETLSTNRKNLSGLAAKFKQQRSLFGNDFESTCKDESEQMHTNKENDKNTSLVELSGIMRFNSKNSSPCYQARNLLKKHFNENTHSPEVLIYQKRNRSRTDSIIHVRDTFDSENLKNYSTSPSGRLQSVLNLSYKELPTMLLNDKPLPNTSMETIYSEDSEKSKNITEIHNDATINRSIMKDKEDDLNLSNLNFLMEKKLQIKDDTELLFNVSDTILNDISM